MSRSHQRVTTRREVEYFPNGMPKRIKEMKTVETKYYRKRGSNSNCKIHDEKRVCLTKSLFRFFIYLALLLLPLALLKLDHNGNNWIAYLVMVEMVREWMGSRTLAYLLLLVLYLALTYVDVHGLDFALIFQWLHAFARMIAE